MTEEQAKQYEICKIRKHEAVPTNRYANQGQSAAQGFVDWKTCKWCGVQFTEVQAIQQIEKA